MSAIDKLKSGDFNTMRQDKQPDGSIIITITKRGEGRSYRLRVRDLYGPGEEVLEEEEIEVS